jgi:hypothetical protein
MLASSEIALNGQSVLNHHDVKHHAKVIEVPVFLHSGNNKLTVELHGKPGDILTIGIHAPVDRIALKPVSEPLTIGIDKLSAEATISGLGIAASGIDVSFSIQGLGNIEELSATTDAQGKAKVQFLDFPLPGEGQLIATIKQAKTIQSTWTSLTVVGAPSIAIQQSLTQIGVKVGQQASLTVTINFTPGSGDTRTYQILAQQAITPNDGGLTVTPIDGWTSVQPFSKTATVTLTGLKTGTYTVTTTASVVKARAAPGDKPLTSLSAALIVGVFKPEVDQSLFLGAPTGNPSALSLGTNQ